MRTIKIEPVAMANRLAKYCSGNNVHLEFKVAHELAEEWSSQDQAEVKANNYWVSGSLTGLRNAITASDKNELLILVGSAKVTDGQSRVLGPDL